MEKSVTAKSGPFRIICVHPSPDTFPLGLGMCLAYGRLALPADRFDLGPRFVGSFEELENQLASGRDNVVLCSNYFWNTENNLSFSRRAKALDPSCIVVHGGPNTPCYPSACEDFLRKNPCVDYAVNGEGEVTFAELMLVLGGERDGFPDGVSALDEDRLVRISNRKPELDLDRFPSPYLDGLFDGVDTEKCIRAAIETNRGCPYSCTYCSWSHPLDSLNQHRMRLFDMRRVREEIDWVARMGFKRLFITDSNFGILDRDLEVAEMVLEARSRFGYPKIVTVNYAKNKHQSILKIVETLERKKMLSDGGIISLQTRDPGTLEAIGRKNIKTDEYDRLKEGFNHRGLPLNVQLMMGLPGATPEAFMNDLRYYFDQPVETTLYRTIMLPNSPMADPEYRRKHRIVIDEHSLVVSTADTSDEKMIEMVEIGCLFDAVQNLGLLRLPLSYLALEKNCDVIGLLQEIVRDQQNHGRMSSLKSHLPPEHPDVIHMAFRSKKNRPRFDWSAIHREFEDWLSQRYDIKDDPAFSCLLETQTWIMPVENRDYPVTVDLPFNVKQWYLDREQGKNIPLGEYGPDTLTVREPCYFWKRFLRKNFYK